MKRTTIEVHLGYYKQGDDLQEFLKRCKDPCRALRAHAEQMRAVAQHLTRIADRVEGRQIKIEADTHSISIECSGRIAEALVEEGLAEHAEWEG